jgi:hypothetical protein
MNNARDLAAFIHPAKNSKMNFTRPRQQMEALLGRQQFLKWEEADEGDEGDDNKAQPPGDNWPWQMDANDKRLLSSSKAHSLLMWEAPGSGFRIPKRLFYRLGHLKIHDWIAMSGGVFAYFLAQCNGIADDHKSLLADYTYALVCHTHWVSNNTPRVSFDTQWVLNNLHYQSGPHTLSPHLRRR